jgi:hypothetical protein
MEDEIKPNSWTRDISANEVSNNVLQVMGRLTDGVASLSLGGYFRHINTAMAAVDAIILPVPAHFSKREKIAMLKRLRDVGGKKVLEVCTLDHKNPANDVPDSVETLFVAELFFFLMGAATFHDTVTESNLEEEDEAFFLGLNNVITYPDEYVNVSKLKDSINDKKGLRFKYLDKIKELQPSNKWKGTAGCYSDVIAYRGVKVLRGILLHIYGVIDLKSLKSTANSSDFEDKVRSTFWEYLGKVFTSSDYYQSTTISANGQSIRCYIQAAYEMATDLVSIDADGLKLNNVAL